MAGLNSLNKRISSVAGEIESVEKSLKSFTIKTVAPLKEEIQEVRTLALKRQDHGGGNANRNIQVNGNSSTLSRYTDINFKAGSNIVLAYANNDTTKTTDITITASVAGGGGGGGHVIQYQGSVFAQRANLNFIGSVVGVTDDAGNDATNVTITGGGGTPGGSDMDIQFNDGGSFGGDSHLTYNKNSSVLHAHKIAGDASDGLILESANGTDVGILGAANTANVTWYGNHNFDTVTASRVAQFGASKTLQSSSVTTVELGYVSGVTSPIQSQFASVVTASSVIADNTVVRGDGGARGVQSSGASIDDSGNITANNLSGINTGDQTITLSGIVTGSGQSSIATSFGTFTSSTLAAALTNETGSGLAVFNTAPTFETSLTGNYLTASEILITNGSKNIVSAPVATYPSLTELTYVKGVTSAIQTQLTALASPLTTKGDLFTFSSVKARLPVGMESQSLVVRTAGTTSLAWEYPNIIGNNTYYLANVASDISTYYDLIISNEYSVGSLGSSSVTVTTTPTLLAAFATESGFPNVTTIPVGTFTFSYTTDKVAGAVKYSTYAELYKRASGGTETLLLTSLVTTGDATNSALKNQTSAVSASEITLLATDRLVVKIYATMASSTATIALNWDSTTNAVLTVPAGKNNFLNLVGVPDIVNSPQPWINVSANHTYDYQDNFSFLGTAIYGATMPPVINFGGTHTFKKDGGILGMGFIFYANATMTNEVGSNRTFGPVYTLVDQNTYTANTNTITHAVLYEILLGPTVTTSNSGTYNLTTMAGIVSGLTVGTNATVTNRIGLLVQAPTVSGTLTNQAGIQMDAFTQAGTSNVHILLGTSTYPSGNFGIYQSNGVLNRWAGGHRFSSRAITTTTTLDTRDTFVEMTGTGTYTVTLPAASTNTGRTIYFTKVSATGTVTIDGNASENINGAANYTMTGVAYQCTAIWCNGTEWFRII